MASSPVVSISYCDEDSDMNTEECFCKTWYFTVTMTHASMTKLIGEEQETSWALKYQCLRKCVLVLARKSFLLRFNVMVKAGIRDEHAGL